MLLRRARPLGIPHPATVTERPANAGGWLAKETVAPAAAISCRAALATSERRWLFPGARRGPRRLGTVRRQWAAARACSASASSGRRRRRAAHGAMAARCGRPPRPNCGAADGSPRSCGVARAFKLKGLASRRFPGEGRTRRCCSKSTRARAPRSIFSTAAQSRFFASMSSAVKRASCRRAGLKFGDAMASAIVYAGTGGAAPPGWSGPNGPPTDLSHRNGSTKTARYALWWPARAPDRAPNA